MLENGARYHSTNVAVPVPITPALWGSFRKHALITVIG